MNLQLECVNCIAAQVVSVTALFGFDEALRRRCLSESLALLSRANYEVCPSVVMREVWEHLLTYAETDDPYAEIKARSNAEALREVPRVREEIASAPDPLTLALKYAIAGNLIDFGHTAPITIEEQNERIAKIARSPFTIDHSDALRKALADAKRLLYICDNAGEIVFDRVLLERLRQDDPALELVCAVRGAPTLNDATMPDADAAGMRSVSRVIDTGDNIPGAVLHRASPTFREEFERADVVLAKGQANFEGLYGEDKDNLFFLFMAKCVPICRAVSVAPLSVICLKNEIAP